MKKTFLSITLLFLLCINQLVANELTQKQWFIQVGAYQELDNAFKAKKDYKNTLKELSLYDEERDFDNYITIHKRDKTYLLLIGPYPKKTDAQSIQENLPNYNKITILVPLKKNTYDNFEYNYQFILKKISKEKYNITAKNKDVIDLVRLAPEDEKKIVLDEKIKTIVDYQETQKLLKDKVNFSSQDNGLITALECKGKQIKFSIPVSFSTYFPEENILLFIGEGFGRNMFSTASCQYTKRLPYLIKYAEDKKLRVNGNSLGELGNNKYFIELWDESKKSYVELIDIGIFFSWHLDTQINNIFWNGNNEIFFIRVNDNKREYYQLQISLYKRD